MWLYILLISLIVIIIILTIICINRVVIARRNVNNFTKAQRAKIEQDLLAVTREANLKKHAEDNLTQAFLKECADKRAAAQASLKSFQDLCASQTQQAADRKNEALALNQEIIDNAKESLKKQLYVEKQAQLASYEDDLIDTKVELLVEAQKQYEDALSTWTKEIEKVQEELSEYQKKREAINEEILRQRAIEEQKDFYCICIPDEDLEDINYLLSIVDRLHNKEILSKLIWSEYLQKPFKKMMNNVLGNSDPKNVIYKITNLKTQEIYIGKTSGSVSNRWTEHIKTSLNIGTIKRSNIHKALYQHWSDFSWEVLERVDGEAKLGEREKFYVNFYQSTIYGYNIKGGG